MPRRDGSSPRGALSGLRIGAPEPAAGPEARRKDRLARMADLAGGPLRLDPAAVRPWTLSIEDPSAYKPGAFEAERLAAGKQPIDANYGER